MSCIKQVHRKHLNLAVKLHYFILKKTLNFRAVTVRNWNMTVEVEFASSLPAGLLSVKIKIPDSVDLTQGHCTGVRLYILRVMQPSSFDLSVSLCLFIISRCSDCGMPMNKLELLCLTATKKKAC